MLALNLALVACLLLGGQLQGGYAAVRRTLAEQAAGWEDDIRRLDRVKVDSLSVHRFLKGLLAHNYTLPKSQV